MSDLHKDQPEVRRLVEKYDRNDQMGNEEFKILLQKILPDRQFRAVYHAQPHDAASVVLLRRMVGLLCIMMEDALDKIRELESEIGKAPKLPRPKIRKTKKTPPG